MSVFDYDQSCTLTGQLFTDYFLGRPNFGENPEIDELEHSIFFFLDQPIVLKTETATDKEPIVSIDRIQLAGNLDTSCLRSLRGYGLELNGRLFRAHTGHHYSPVLLSVEGSPKIIDSRNVYEDARPKNTGTGFLLGSGEYIVTAAHVVAGVLGVTITRGLYRHKATVEFFDLENDIALLKVIKDCKIDLIKEREKIARPIRYWMQPQLGENVFCFGFPLRPKLPHSLNMTTGIISAEVGLDPSKIQISAPIQKGNSGGPVFDVRGNLIGIVTSKLLPINDIIPENVNYAVRADKLIACCQELNIHLDVDESETAVSSVELAKLMHSLCYEIECWEQPPIEGEEQKHV